MYSCFFCFYSFIMTANLSVLPFFCKTFHITFLFFCFFSIIFTHKFKSTLFIINNLKENYRFTIFACITFFCWCFSLLLCRLFNKSMYSCFFCFYSFIMTANLSVLPFFCKTFHITFLFFCFFSIIFTHKFKSTLFIINNLKRKLQIHNICLHYIFLLVF